MSKKYNSQQTIDIILATAKELFLEKGFDKTSMQEIASVAGISKGAIYHHFKSKEEIINRVKDQQSNTLIKEANRWAEENTDLTGKEKLITLLKKSVDPTIHNLDNAIKARVKSAEFIVTYMKSCINQSAPLISKIIKEGINDGSLQTNYPDECAEVLVLLLNIWCDPAIFDCDLNKLINKLNFLKDATDAIGLEILSSEIISSFVVFLRTLYNQEFPTYN